MTEFIHLRFLSGKKHEAVFIPIINHVVEPRTNITTILSAEQYTPPAVDGWGYLSAHLDRFNYEVG